MRRRRAFRAQRICRCARARACSYYSTSPTPASATYPHHRYTMFALLCYLLFTTCSCLFIAAMIMALFTLSMSGAFCLYVYFNLQLHATLQHDTRCVCLCHATSPFLPRPVSKIPYCSVAMPSCYMPPMLSPSAITRDELPCYSPAGAYREPAACSCYSSTSILYLFDYACLLDATSRPPCNELLLSAPRLYMFIRYLLIHFYTWLKDARTYNTRSDARESPPAHATERRRAARSNAQALRRCTGVATAMLSQAHASCAPRRRAPSLTPPACCLPIYHACHVWLCLAYLPGLPLRASSANACLMRGTRAYARWQRQCRDLLCMSVSRVRMRRPRVCRTAAR